MGSPLSPILADIVMQDLEERAISSLSLHLPFYFRYVDDTALAAPSASCQKILHVFNSFHKRLQFTIEIADENTLNFLDVSITINNNFIESDTVNLRFQGDSSIFSPNIRFHIREELSLT